MLLITGATGHLGTAVVDQLLQTTERQNFAVLARSAQKAARLSAQGVEVRIGDFNLPASLDAAFAGVSTVLLISTMELNRFEQHRNVIDAAVRAGVRQVVYTSLAIRDIASSQVRELMQSHFDTERYLQESRLEYTIVRNSMYAEAIPAIIGATAGQSRIALPAGHGAVPYVLRRELGEALANLLRAERQPNQIIHLVGRQLYTYADLAAALSALQGRPLEYVEADPEEYRQRLKALGWPEFLIYLTSGTLLDIKHQQYALHSPALEQALGRPALSLPAMLAEIYR